MKNEEILSSVVFFSFFLLSFVSFLFFLEFPVWGMKE